MCNTYNDYSNYSDYQKNQVTVAGTMAYLIGAKTEFFENGMMKKGTVKEAVRLLIEENVFSSVKDMRLQALKDYNIFFPAWVFELVKEKKE